MKNVLIIGAHFDDCELGCGGTAAVLASQGCSVYKLTLTDNFTDYGSRNIVVSYEASKEASARACTLLGIEELDFDYVECNHLKYQTELMQTIERIIEEKHIDTVFIHYEHDLNQDHVEASRLSLTASRHIDNVFFYQSNCYLYSKPFCPTFFVDISSAIEKKIAALKQYGSEHNRFGNMFETNINRNRVWGYGNHAEYAEGFIPVRMIMRHEDGKD